MKKCVTLSAILFFCMALSMDAQNAKQFLKAGLDFKAVNNYKDAIEQFSKAVSLEPDYVEAYIERAYAYEKTDQFDLAAEDYKRALVFETKTPEIYYDAARISSKTGKFEEAAGYLEKSLELRSKYLEAFQLQSTVLLELNNNAGAQLAAKKALALKDNDVNHYLMGVVNERLNLLTQAEEEYGKAISKNKRYIEAYIAIANLRVKLNKLDLAVTDCNTAISIDQNNTEAYLTRSRVYVKKLDYPRAIDDISRNILLKPNDKQMYFIRGTYYQEFTQHQNAINDFTKVLLLDEKNAEALYKRAFSFEQIGDFKAAIKDYQNLTKLSEYDGAALKLLDSAKQRLFDLNREDVNPVITLSEPLPFNADIVNVPKNITEIAVKGRIKEESDLKILIVNGQNVPFVRNGDYYDFFTNVNISQADVFTVTAVDAYDNIQNSAFTIERTEIVPPVVAIYAPYASDNGEIYLDSNDPTIYIEGKVTDESLIKSIFIDGIAASFKIDEMNPAFTATLNITNKSKFSVKTVDIYGNDSLQDFIINREGVSLIENNPMGRTWVIFIENSNYESFPSLDGPSKDVTLMRSALAKYDIHKVIHKKDMSKKEMEKFFSIELRDLIRSNRVNTLLVWYAGHGKFINETGYWIPVEAKRDDEFTYFNINALRASLQSYANNITHVLVITDACESGPTFYQAMRETPKERSCTDWEATRLKSSQVFSSAGYELAVDNSQFTRTFANTLANNPNACIPIESIVLKVTTAVSQNNQQKPKFGKISGLTDEDGTFFFISKN